MTLTIYKISEYVNWGALNPTSYSSGGGTGGAAAVPEHNALLGLQGGAFGSYYHLGAADFTRLTNLSFIDSIVEDAFYQVSLVGDLASPGNNMVYGTNALGVKGWYLSSGLDFMPRNNILYWDINNDWYMPYPNKRFDGTIEEDSSGGGGGGNGGGGGGGGGYISPDSGGILYNWFALGMPYVNPLVDSSYGGLYNWYAFSKGTYADNGYGVLYNWYVATAEHSNILYNWWAATYSTGGASIAPSGWHVPLGSEFDDLFTELGGYTVSGGKLKEIGYAYWDSPNTGATNEVEFNARGSGIRYEYAYDGMFDHQRQYLRCWTSEEVDGIPTFGVDYMLAAYNHTQSVAALGTDKKVGMSIRLIKDDSNNEGTLTDYDGNVYDTVTIGTQVWMASDLKVTHYNNGTVISNVTDNEDWEDLTTGAMCYYKNRSGIKTIVPAGWHLPSTAEFDTLITTTSPYPGRHLKESGTTYWNATNDADNYSGFSARGAGGRSSTDGTFQALNVSAWFHASDDYVPSNLYGLALMNVLSSAANWTSGNQKNHGGSVRLIKDSTTLLNGQTGVVVDYDGNTYSTICIGTQEWMTENLKVTHYDDGSLIPVIKDNTEWINDTAGAMCYYNNAAPEFTSEFCPEFWHIPTDEDWIELLLTLGDSDSDGSDASAGGYLKEVGTTHWLTPNTGADNSTAFTALPSGTRDNLGVFGGRGEYVMYAVATERSFTEQYSTYLAYDSAAISIYNYSSKKRGVAVRLVKNDTFNEGTVTDYDGNEYPTVKIGNQVWMAEDYKCTHYNTGALISLVPEATVWSNANLVGKMCYYNNIL